jgi:2-iminobutanoate/2-iminopropanoate deaminase
MYHHNPMEPHTAIAIWTDDGPTLYHLIGAGRRSKMSANPAPTPDEPVSSSHEGGVMTTLTKEPTTLGMPWEEQYGYAQAVKVGDTVYLSGQISHDDRANILGVDDMEVQMRTAYTNIGKVLAQYGATIDNVVEETLYVRDMDAAFQARVKMKDEVFAGNPVVASTTVQIQRLAFPELLVEIRCVAKM